MVLYIYEPLNLSTSAIRVLRLLKDPDFTSEIRCDLIETILGDIPYEALSYTWGSINRPLEITVNGSELRVTKQLHAALQHLRLPNEDRLLWIDAICINQDDLTERGHQVGQMRLVYENAERVLIWLGLSNTRIDDFFRTMDNSSLRTLEHVGRKFLRSTQEEYWRDLFRDVFREIVERSWFRRVWILQEVASARAATIMCGHNSMSTRLFAMIPSMLDLAVTERVQVVLDIMPGHSRRGSWWHKGQDLHNLLIKFGASEATDERDMIYALLGISSDARESEDFFPDYSKSFRQVLWDTMSYILFHEVLDLSAQEFPNDILVQFYTFPHSLVRSTIDWAMRTSRDDILLKLVGVDTHGLAWRYSEARAVLCDLAYRHRCDTVFRYILSHVDVNANVTDSNGDTPLHIAIKSKSYEKVAMLLTRPDVSLNMANAQGQTPAVEAYGLNSDEIFRVLSAYAERHGNEIGTADKTLKPILKATPSEQRRRMVQGLLAYKGIDVTLSNFKPLLDAVKRSHGRDLDRLLKHYASQAGHDHEHAAVVEALKGERSAMAALALAPDSVIREFLLLQREVCMRLLHQGIFTNDVWAVNQFLNHYRTAINSIVMWVYKPAGHIDRIHGNRSTALWAAAALGHEDVVKMLLDNGADTKLRDRVHDLSPYEVAAQCDHQAVMNRLTDHDANWQSRSQEGDLDQGHTTRPAPKSPEPSGVDLGLEVSSLTAGHELDLWLLRERGGPVNCREDLGRAPLFEATITGNYKEVQRLLEEGADVNIRDQGGRTAREMAILEGHYAMAEDLCEAEQGYGNIDTTQDVDLSTHPRSAAD